MIRISAFLVVVAVIASLMGCTETHVSEYTLTIFATDGGSVTDPGPGAHTYEFGEVVSLLAEAEHGYQFVNWTGEVETVDNVDAAETTITIRADYSISANFALVPQDPVVQFDLTVSSTAGGSVTGPGEGVFTYDTDMVVDLVAVADECYEFAGWTGDTGDIADPGSATTTVTMDADYTITASFARLRYQLTVSSTTFGSVTGPGEGTYFYDCGTRVNLLAKPAVHCRFIGWAGDVTAIDDVNAPRTTVLVNGDLTITARFEVIPMVTAGIVHTIGLKSDGTVVATGYNEHGQCDVDHWTDIVQVAAGERHTIGLRSDGTVVAAGGSHERECNVGGWTDIVQVDCGRYHTVGLRSDGTLVATGRNSSGQCNVGDWTDIVQLAAGFYHTVGLRPDGTVVAVGATHEGRLEVGDWFDIVQVGAGGHHTMGLRSDGTVLAVGRDNHGETRLDNWVDIIQVAGGCQSSIGLRADGTVVHSGWCMDGKCRVGDWSGIIQVDGGMFHNVGLRADGSVVTVGRNISGQCDVDDWVLG